MEKIILKTLFTLLLSALFACTPVTTKPIEPIAKTNKILYADGFGQSRNIPQLTQVQNQYAAEQAAKIDAYRDLAKQLYLEQLTQEILVADQVLKDDLYRVYLDLFLREAKVIKSTQIAEQNKVTLQLDLTPRFYHCLSFTVKKVSSCIKEDNKTPFTRVGYQHVPSSTVNLSCATADCSTQLLVSGFSKEKGALDRTLLDYGLYDSEWTVNVALRSALRYFIHTGL